MSTVEDRIQEAHENFINGRFMNAARLLQGPIQTMSEKAETKDFLDAFYMSYFRMVALHRAENDLELINTLQNLSESMQKFAAKLCMTNISQDGLDLKERLQYIEIVSKILVDLNMESEYRSLERTKLAALQELVPTLQEEGEKLYYLRELLKVVKEDEKLETNIQIEELLLVKADRLRNYNTRELETGGIPKDIEESQTYLELAKFYRECDAQKMESALLNSMKCTEARISDRYGFPKFENEEDIAEYIENQK